MYLYVEIAHEAAHELLRYRGTDKNGKDTKENISREEVEPGNIVEEEVWKIPATEIDYTRSLPYVIEGVKPLNPKNRANIMKNVVNNAKKTEEGKKTLVTTNYE